jgi:protein-S-isoprenylcysteine O-methyltransferase Ste14
MPKLPAAPLSLGLRARNALAAVALVWVACALYAAAPWNGPQLREWHSVAGVVFSGIQFLIAAATTYSLIVAAWLLPERDPQPGKSLRFCGLVMRTLRAPRASLATGLVPADRLALRVTLLKAFFGPLMAMSLMGFCMSALNNGRILVDAFGGGLDALPAFNRWGFWFLLQLILFVDVAIFTVGYLVETRRLGNQIRSVDPTWLGWAAALLCYPPFNTFTAMILGAQHSDFPQFESATAHLALNALLLALMAVYASASVALGLKASNLTHRGIVARGPYAIVRHPAYTCKSMAWWIGSAPLVWLAFDRGLGDGLLALSSVAGWTLLYVLRALTEEDHLRRVDGEYAAYAERVRYRFLPGLF